MIRAIRVIRMIRVIRNRGRPDLDDIWAGVAEILQIVKTELFRSLRLGHNYKRRAGSGSFVSLHRRHKVQESYARLS